MIDAGSQLLSQRNEVPLLLRTMFAALVSEVQTLRRRDAVQRAALERLEAEIRSVADLQRDILPARLPEVRGLQVHTLYRPAEAVSGDLYDVVRLDATRVAFTLADATGHGLPAGMLSALARRSLDGRGQPELQPDQLLARANRDVLDLCLSECQFVGALYAVFDESTRSLSWARGGLPYPILIRDGVPRQIASTGPALGTVDEAVFEVVTVTLRPGDRVVFHTDGVDALVATRPGTDVSASDWFAGLGRQSLECHLEALDACLAEARCGALDADDVTLIALQAA